jgi:hypothetical protein
MTSEPLILAAAALIGLLVIAATLLKGWQGWLSLKAREFDRSEAQHRPEIEGGAGSGQMAMTSRIEIADLKERIRKLEAIAAGVDL